MLALRLVIFISAVSRELRSTRDLVAKTLIALGYEPKWQDIVPTESGDLRAVLRKWVDESHAVLQIVGHRYGHGPREPDETFGQVSYTQYEALYAKAKGKKVWYIILDGHHPTDCPDDEPEDLKKLQADYRIHVKAHHGLYHSSPSLDRTEIIILKLRDDLALLRAEFLESQRKQDETLTTIWEQTSALPEHFGLLLAAIRDVPRAVTEAQQAAPQDDEATRTARAYASLEESLKLPPGTLAKELPAFAEKLLASPDTSEMDRANALFATKQYAQSEVAALAAAGKPVRDAIAALILAGQSATEQIQYKRALEHYRTAAALTSVERDVLEWANIQNKIGSLLYLDGQYDAYATLMHRVWQACEKVGLRENYISLTSHFLWANALVSQGNYVEAEKEHRAVRAIRERVLGLEHPDSMKSRNNLALVLRAQGKYVEAEQENRPVLGILERVLGSEHPDTLKSRMNLANALDSQGKYSEAEKEHRVVLTIRERILGSEHPDTLASRNDLALVLDSQGKYSETEKEYRVVLTIRERFLGPEHPATLSCRMNLANVLNSQGKYPEAEKEHRAVLAIRERDLDPEHPDILSSRNNLALALYSQGKYPVAEKEHRAVLAIRERVLGSEHPKVSQGCYNLSLCLRGQGKKAEALQFARRALAGCTKVLGVEHPYTLDAKRLVENLEKP